MGNGSFQNYIRGVIQEPALVHLVKVMGNPIHHIFVLYHQKIFILPTNVVKNLDTAKSGREKSNSGLGHVYNRKVHGRSIGETWEEHRRHLIVILAGAKTTSVRKR